VSQVSTERELDALPKGTRVRFTASGAVCTKTIGDLWLIEGHKGCYMPSELVMNGTPMDVLDA
jgi:hypothetical protein